MHQTSKGIYLLRRWGEGSRLRSGLGRLQRGWNLGIRLRVLTGGARQREHDPGSFLHIVEPERFISLRPLWLGKAELPGLLHPLKLP